MINRIQIERIIEVLSQRIEKQRKKTEYSMPDTMSFYMSVGGRAAIRSKLSLTHLKLSDCFDAKNCQAIINAGLRSKIIDIDQNSSILKVLIAFKEKLQLAKKSKMKLPPLVWEQPKSTSSSSVSIVKKADFAPRY